MLKQTLTITISIDWDLTYEEIMQANIMKEQEDLLVKIKEVMLGIMEEVKTSCDAFQKTSVSVSNVYVQN